MASVRSGVSPGVFPAAIRSCPWPLAERVSIVGGGRWLHNDGSGDGPAFVRTSTAMIELLRLPHFRIALVSAAFFFLGQYALAVSLPLWLSGQSMPDWQIALVLGTFGVSSIVLRPLAGSLVDITARGRMAAFGAITLAAGIGLSLVVRDPIAWMIVRCVQALGYVAFSTAATTVVAETGPAAGRSQRLALFGIGANLAMVMAPALVVLAEPQVGTPAVLAGAAGLAVVSFALAAFLPTTSPGARRERTKILMGIPKRLRLPFLLAVLFGLSWGAFYQFLPLLAARNGLGPAGLLYTVYGISIIATRVLSARLLGHSHWPIGRALALTAIACAMLSVATGWPVSFAAIILLAVGSGIAHPALISRHVAEAPADAEGRAVAVFYLGFDLGIGAGAWVLAPVLQLGGVGALFAVAGLVAAAAGYAARFDRDAVGSDVEIMQPSPAK
jgi:predicted MFS family arabinose efflux permease